MSNYFYRIGMMISIIFFPLLANAQFPIDEEIKHERFVSSIAGKSPLFLVLVHGEEQIQLMDSVQFPFESSLVHFYFFDLDRLSLDDVCQKTNERILDAEFIDLRRVYLVLWGDEEFRKMTSSLSRELFTDEIYIDNSEQPIDYEFLMKIVDRFSREQKWEFDAFKLKENAIIESRENSPERSFFIGRSTNFLQASGPNTSSIDRLGMWEFGYNRGLSDKFILRFDLGGGINVPKPSDFSSQIFDQIDFQAILDGEDLEVSLNTDISASIAGRFGVGLDYYLTKKNNWFRPYLGFSLGAGFTTLIEGTIDSTFTIEGGDFGSVIGGGGSLDLNSDDSSVDSYTYFEPRYSARAGISFRAGERISFNTQMQYDFSSGNLVNRLNTLNVVQWSVGVRYHFLGKRVRDYRYLRVQELP